MDDFRLQTIAPTHWIDDLVIGPGSIVLCRTGMAQYTLAFRSHSGRELTLKLWTASRGVISADCTMSVAWVQVQIEDQWLTSLRATDCCLQLEHLDRGHYFLGLWRSDDQLQIHLRSPGYLKAAVSRHVAPG